MVSARHGVGANSQSVKDEWHRDVMHDCGNDGTSSRDSCFDLGERQHVGTSRTCKIRASRSDDSACSMVLYDLLAIAFCRARIFSTLPSDPNAMSARHPDAQTSSSLCPETSRLETHG